MGLVLKKNHQSDVNTKFSIFNQCFLYNRKFNQTWLSHRSHQYIFTFFYWNRHGSSIKQTWIPITQKCFVPNLVVHVISQEVLENFFLKLWNTFHYWFPFTQGCFAPISIEIDTVALGNRMKKWKINEEDNGPIIW